MQTSHDHEVVVNGETYRLNLVKDNQGKSMYQVSEDVPRYSNDVLFSQSDWSGGFGQLNFADPTMYLDGQNIDTFTPGRVFLSPAVNKTALVKHFLDGAEAYVFGAPGSYTDELTESRDPVASDMTLLPAVPEVGDAYYFGSARMFSQVHIVSTVPGEGVWTITWEYYNADTTWDALSGVVDSSEGFTEASGIWTTSFNTPSSSWATVVVDGSAAMYWVRARVTAYTSVVTPPTADQAWVSTNYNGVISDLWEPADGYCFFQSADLFYCWTENHLYEETGNEWTERFQAPTGGDILDVKEFDQIMYVALGSGAAYYSTADGATYTVNDLANHHAIKFLSAPNPAATAYVLWKLEEPNELTYTTDGQAVADGGQAWSSPAYIGDTSTDVTNVFLHNDKLLVGKTNDLVHYDSSGGTHSWMGSLAANPNSLNFKYTTSWQSGTYFTLNNELGEISAYESFDIVGPALNLRAIGYDGTYRGIVGDMDYLYCVVEKSDGGNYIFKGKEVRTNSGLVWRWCPWIYQAGDIEAIAVYDDQLWFSVDDTPCAVDLDKSPLLDATFCSSGYIELSQSYGTNPYWKKIPVSTIAETEDLTETENVQPMYLKDQETSYSNLTDPLVSSGVNQTIVKTNIPNNRIQYKLVLSTNQYDSTPVVKLFQVKGTEVPQTIKIHEAVYSLGDEPSRRTSTIRTMLRAARDSTELVKFADLRYGESTGAYSNAYHWVVLMPGYPQEIEVVQEKGRQPELGLKVRWQEVPFTVI